MIRKLRRKLIAAAMLSLFLVLLIIMGTVNLLNYEKIVSRADQTLSILKENDGNFPQKPVFEPRRHDRDALPPELPYESRFFSVLLDDAGQSISADIGKIAAVDTDEAVQFAQQVWGSGKKSGFMGDYRYARQELDGSTRIIFLDCTRDLSTFRAFLLASLGISALGLLAVLGLIFLFSNRIIRPVLESYEKQKQFITDAGHEIKTPLTIIDADAEVLGMEVGENEWLADIQAQTKRLADLTNHLILLSRMEEAQNQMQMLEFPFSDLVQEAAQSFQALAKTQEKSFTASIQPMISLRGDERALRQLVSTLLDNAVKYSGENGRVRLTLEKQGKSVLLSVENTIASPMPENLDRLFDRFYRADKSRNSQIAGYGLGLSIAKAITDAHKGKICAVSPDGETLSIRVTLPAQ